MKTKKYKINKGFIVQKIGKKITIFDGEESALYNFNETASFIFQKLKLGWDREKIVNKLISIYNIKKIEAEKDFDELIRNLIKKGIVK